MRVALAGRLDLTQAEAVLGVIDARGKNDLDTALKQMAGGIAGPLQLLRDELLQLLAELEAGLDFAEEDIEFASSDEVLRRVSDACRVLDDLAEQMAYRHTSNMLEQIALVGIPGADLTAVAHHDELVPRPGYVVHIDAAHRGLGTASCGPDTAPSYLVPPGVHRWSWTLRAL